MKNNTNYKSTRWGVCKVCRRRGEYVWYKAQPAIVKKFRKIGRKLRYPKQLVCNHFMGRSKDRNDFCYQPGTVKEAKPDEVVVTYHIRGKEAPIP
jgi:hypothetical protein